MTFDPFPLFFYGFAAVLVIAALRIITAKNSVHAALFLVLAFFTGSGIWMLLKAEFLAIALVLVYVGAVMVLFLFVVMMLDLDMAHLGAEFKQHLPLAILIGAVIVAEMTIVLVRGFIGTTSPVVPLDPQVEANNTLTLGKWIYGDYVFAFEIAGVILLVAIVAAVALTLRRRKDNKTQDISAQIRTRSKDRIRIVSMPSDTANRQNGKTQ